MIFSLFVRKKRILTQVQCTEVGVTQKTKAGILESAKYNLIYEYYKCRILFGDLQEGDYLSTIEQIGDIFQVAPQTVRNALKKLQSEGLITVSAGRNTMVIHKTTPEETLRFTKNYYLSRKNVMEEVYLVANLLLMPLYRKGCQMLTDADLLRISTTVRQGKSNIASISMFCCDLMMNKIDNWLAKSLFLDMVSFFQFPYVPSFNEGSNEDYQRNCRLLSHSCETLDRDGVFRAFTGLQALTRKTLRDYIDEATLELSVPGQIPFHWQTYRGRPQHCHTLAANIIHEIITGKYAEKDLLPSYEIMSAEFDVSINTARRTIDLLKDMGIINSINGVGKQILFSSPDWKKMRRPTMRNNADMASESLEILLLSSKEIIHGYLPLLPDNEIGCLKKVLANKKDRRPMEIVILIAEYMTVAYPSDMVLETYSKLFEPLLLVYPLLSDRTPTIAETVSCCMEMMNRALDDRDPKSFTQGFLELLDLSREAVVHIQQALRDQ